MYFSLVLLSTLAVCNPELAHRDLVATFVDFGLAPSTRHREISQLGIILLSDEGQFQKCLESA